MPRLGAIAERLGLSCDEGVRDRELHGVATLAEAGPDEVSFLANPRYKEVLQASRAGAVLVRERDRDGVPEGTVALVCEDPYGLLPELIRVFHPEPAWGSGVAASAMVDPGARIAGNARIETGTIIEAGVEIGAGSRIGPGCVIEAGAVIGENCLLHARVVVGRDCRLGNRVVVQAGAIVGSDGFGFAPTASGLRKIPQVGNVVIEDDVEIGANTTVDRATFGSTRIRRGAKLDNLIQVAHNVEIGPFTVIAAQTGVSGSTRIGGGCMIGGQVGITGHLRIGDGVRIGAQSGVMRDVADGGVISGSPAIPHRTWLRSVATLERLARRRGDEK